MSTVSILTFENNGGGEHCDAASDLVFSRWFASPASLCGTNQIIQKTLVGLIQRLNKLSGF